GAEAADVTSAEVAVGREDIGQPIRLVGVATDKRGCAGGDVARHAGRQVVPVLVDDADVNVRHRTAARSRVSGTVRWAHDGHHARLGGAVLLVEDVAERLGNPRHERGSYV